jgi:hypothetical protein
MSPELLTAVITGAFWAVALVTVGWKALPLVFRFMGLSRIECEVVEHFPKEIAAERTEEYAEFRRQALELGFKPLGTLVRRFRFVSGWWSMVQAETIYGSNMQECFTGAAPNFLTRLLETGATSSLTNGVLIWTANSLPPYELTTGGLTIRQVDTTSLAKLLRQHQENVRQIRREGVALANHEQVQTLLDALRRHFAGQIEQWDAVTIQELFRVSLFCAVVPVAFSYGFCGSGAIVPLNVLIGAVLHTAWLRWHLWKAIRHARREHARRLRADHGPGRSIC